MFFWEKTVTCRDQVQAQDCSLSVHVRRGSARCLTKLDLGLGLSAWIACSPRVCTALLHAIQRHAATLKNLGVNVSVTYPGCFFVHRQLGLTPVLCILYVVRWMDGWIVCDHEIEVWRWNNVQKKFYFRSGVLQLVLTLYVSVTELWLKTSILLLDSSWASCSYGNCKLKTLWSDFF